MGLMRPDFLDARQLEALKAVFDSGSITRAAEKIGKSQSAVTRLIQELELEIGFSVLVRKGPKVTPTENGLNLYREAEHYLAGLAAISRGARLVAQSEKASLAVSTISALATSIVPSSVADVVGNWPDAEISVEVETSEMVTKSVLDQRADVGLIGFAPDTPGIQFHWVAQVPFIALVRRDDPLAKREALSATDFTDRHLIAVSGRYRMRVMFERALADYKAFPASIIIANASYVSISHAIIPQSIALVQSVAVHEGIPAGLKMIPLDFYLPYHFGLITAVGKPMGPIEIEAIAQLERHSSYLPGYKKCDAFPDFGQPL